MSLRSTPWAKGAASSTKATLRSPPSTVVMRSRCIEPSATSSAQPILPRPGPLSPTLSPPAGRVQVPSPPDGETAEREARPPSSSRAHQLLARPDPGRARPHVDGLQPVGAGEARVDAAQRDGHVGQSLVLDHGRHRLQVLVGGGAHPPAARAVLLAGDDEVVALAPRRLDRRQPQPPHRQLVARSGARSGPGRPSCSRHWRMMRIDSKTSCTRTTTRAQTSPPVAVMTSKSTRS